ncbi:MAG: transposase [Planctomycetales bacterium]|nr:transposase [Planctomycetales bacterium]
MRRDWEHANPPPRTRDAWMAFLRKEFRQVEKWIDAGHGACWLRQPRYAGKMIDTLMHSHQVHYELGCFAVMPNHVHLVVRPFGGVQLENLIGAIKTITAREINRREARSGPLWHQESYDRILRDEDHLWHVVQYIGRNPRQAGLPKHDWHRWLNPAWEPYGWRFVD